MDTKKLVADMKARFAHNSAKHYLKEKYSSKFIVADQGGLWKADPNTLSFLYTAQEKTILVDLYDNPITIDAQKLYKKLLEVYNLTMQEWHEELKELEKTR